jgi:hypothetical protein
MNAALLLSEAINESADSKTPVWMAMFDAAKDFDVVWQNSLLLKLHNIGIDGQLWLLLEEWYRGQKSAVKWKGDISRTFYEQQGVRQGGILSPALYKAFVNPLLVDLQDHNIGYHIGSTFVGIPACTDDVTVIAVKPKDLQSMIDVAENYANRERYHVNTTKTHVQYRQGTTRQKNGTLLEDTNWYLYNKPLAVVDTHILESIGTYSRTMALLSLTVYSVQDEQPTRSCGLDSMALTDSEPPAAARCGTPVLCPVFYMDWR